MSQLFALIHAPGGDRAASYAGMDEPTVTALLTATGFPFELIDEPTYDAFVLAHQPVPLTVPQLLAIIRSQASAAAVTGGDALATLLRAEALVIMDELNILRQRDVDRTADIAAATTLADLKTRWAARSALPQRNASQIKTAIQAKIDSGAGD